MELNYKLGAKAIEDEEFLRKCVTLYSNHYGTWNCLGRHPKEQIKLSKKRMITWLEKDKTSIYYAEENGVIIGYAIACRKSVKNFGVVSWVTQLVVHTDYRNQGIAKKLLYSIWCMSNDTAWGIVTSNPYAIRALEKATRRRTEPSRIKKDYRKLINISSEFAPYINKNTEIKIDKYTAQINTNFYIDHSDIQNKINNIVSEDVKWKLGDLQEGWEWFVFTFNDQQQIELTTEEIAKMISDSEEITKKAYEKMNFNTREHKWMNHTEAEVQYIKEKCNIKYDDTILDFGCGIGRHTIPISNFCKQAIGIDYIERNIETANEKVKSSKIENAFFITEDCRTFKYKKQVDGIICVYDVIGTFKIDSDNVKIIKQIAYNLKTKGKALISVMNYESTLANAKYKFEFDKNPNPVLDLASSETMSTTGNIFNPDFYLVDTKTRIIYRKEQFSNETDMPVEYVVMDRRYSMDEIVALCEKNGLRVIEKKYVNAKNWNISLNAKNKKAKEILLLCEKM